MHSHLQGAAGCLCCQEQHRQGGYQQRAGAAGMSRHGVWGTGAPAVHGGGCREGLLAWRAATERAGPMGGQRPPLGRRPSTRPVGPTSHRCQASCAAHFSSPAPSHYPATPKASFTLCSAARLVGSPRTAAAAPETAHKPVERVMVAALLAGTEAGLPRVGRMARGVRRHRALGRRPGQGAAALLACVINPCHPLPAAPTPSTHPV